MSGICLTHLVMVGWHKRGDGNNIETIFVAIINMRMEELNREVQEHNSFVHHAPMLEKRIKVINRQKE